MKGKSMVVRTGVVMIWGNGVYVMRQVKHHNTKASGII